MKNQHGDENDNDSEKNMEKEQEDNKNIEEEKYHSINSVKITKHLNLNLETITEKNNANKKSTFNPIIDKKIESKIKSPKLKLSINDDSTFGGKINTNSEFKIIENKMYKIADKGILKKNVIKKKICK